MKQLKQGLNVKFTSSRLAFKRWYDKEAGEWRAEMAASDLELLQDENDKLRRVLEEVKVLLCDDRFNAAYAKILATLEKSDPVDDPDSPVQRIAQAKTGEKWSAGQSDKVRVLCTRCGGELKLTQGPVVRWACGFCGQTQYAGAKERDNV